MCGEKQYAAKSLDGRPEGKRPLGRCDYIYRRIILLWL
jgi:hypothetical protein